MPAHSPPPEAPPPHLTTSGPTLDPGPDPGLAPGLGPKLDHRQDHDLAQRLLRRGTTVPWAIALLFLVLALSGGLGGLALRDRIIDDAKRELDVLATSIAAITDERLNAIDRALRRVVLQVHPNDLDGDADTRTLSHILSIEQQSATRVITALAVVDADARVLAASRAAILTGRTETGRTETGAAWSNIGPLRQGKVLHVGDARDGAQFGFGPGAIVVISRAIHDGKQLAGAVEAILFLDAHDGLLHVPPLAEGLHLALRHAAGPKLVEWTGGRSIGNAADSLVATTPLPRFGLVVTASRPLDAVLATWRKSMQTMAAVTLILCAAGIGLALLARLLTQRQAALARAAVQRAETADAIADTVNIMLWSMDARTRRWNHLSPSFTRLTGYPRQVFYERPDAWLDLIHPDDRQKARDAFADLPEATSIEYRVRTASGSEIVLRDSAHAVRDARGEIIRYDGMAIDVTRQKHAEAALDDARRIARLGTWQILLPERTLEWSHEIYEQFRVDPATFSLTVESAVALIHPDDRAMVSEKLALAERGGTPDFDFRGIRGDGTTGWFWSEARLARDANGVPVRIYGVCHDITDRKNAEERAARASQLAALGELTGGIAHDFNNLLAVVRLNLEIAADGLTDPSLRDCMANAVTAAEQGAKLTSQLLAFARRQPMQGRHVEISAALQRVGRMLDHGLGRQVKLTIDVEPEAIEVAADEAQFDSAVMNLALNARDAMPHGGVIEIRARVVTLGPTEAEALGLAAGEHARLTISDDGQGMSAETQARAFEPFFTTKRGGKGNGLGLAMVYGFVKQARGEITLASVPGRGTTITLWLPLAPAAAPGIAAEAPATRAETWAGTVLLVEDEQGLREAGTRLLREAGFTVHAAASTEAALALLDSLATPPDLLFTDIMLGGWVDGFSLARDVRARFPGIAVLYTSGYVGDEQPREADAPILRKPFGAAALREAVAAALARGEVVRREG